jgi:predicted acylesterase/phospholipase RssA
MSAAALGPEAVVLSGGGAKGAYEVGVLTALATGASPATGYRPIAPEIFSGTSVGSYNAAFLATRPGDFGAAVALLRDVWLQRVAAAGDRCGNGVYRVRGLPFQGLNPGCFLHPVQALKELAADGVFLAGFAVGRGLGIARSQVPPLARLADTVDIAALFSTSPLENLVATTLDCRRLAAGAQLFVVATNWQTGGGRVFTGAEIAGQVGTAAVRASVAIPGIFNPVVIDGTPYVDGGVHANTPMVPALAAGARQLHVIYLDPTTASMPLPALPDTFETIYRLYTILVASHFQRALAALRAGILPSAGGGGGGGGAARSAAAGEPWRHGAGAPRPGPGVLPIVHTYRPSNDLGGLAGLLEFRLSAIERLISEGYADAVAHDCAAAGCLLPGDGGGGGS